MFWLTKMRAEPKAQIRPLGLEAETSNVQATMTPMVRGRSDVYVFKEYLTPKRSAYAATVNRGDKALGVSQKASTTDTGVPTFMV